MNAYILIAKSSCGNEIVGGGRELVPQRGHENSDSGEETPVSALFPCRGCSSTPSSRLGPGASTRGPSTGPSVGSGLAAFPKSLLATSIDAKTQRPLIRLIEASSW